MKLSKDVELAASLSARGYTYAELSRSARLGTISRVRRGAYAQAAPEGAAARHRQLVLATLPTMAPDSCLSHVSAALWHHLPVWDSALRQVHVTRNRRTSGRRNHLVHVHAAELPATDVLMLDGVCVTSLARTVVDCARTLPYEQAVAIGDAALHTGLGPDALNEVLRRPERRHGGSQARRVVSFLDPRAESAGESWSRVTFADLGLPTPDLQFEVFDSLGRLLACTDFAWEEFRTLGEFDGKIKYGRLLRPGETPGDAVFREKRREDGVRDEQWEVVRWTWNELYRPDLLGTRLRRAFARGSRRAG